jgi:hypothetical protein
MPLLTPLTPLEARLAVAAPTVHAGHGKRIASAAWVPPPPPDVLLGGGGGGGGGAGTAAAVPLSGALAPAAVPALLATGGADSALKLWTLEPSGALRRSDALRGHASGTVDALAWNGAAAPGTVLATGATDRSVRVWDTRAARVAAVISLRSSPLHAAWTPSGDALVVGTRDDVLITIDARRGAVISSTQLPLELNQFAFARVAQGGGAGGAGEGATAGGVGSGAPPALLYAGVGVRGATNDEGGLNVLALRGIATAAAAAAAARAASATAAAGAPGGGAKAGGPAGAPTATGAPAAPPAAVPVPAPTVTELVRVRGHAAPVTQVRFSPDGTRVATGAGDGVVAIWDASELAVLRTHDRAEGPIRGISWSHDGAHLAIASGGAEETQKTLEIVRAEDGTRVRAIVAPTTIGVPAWCPAAPGVLSYSVDSAVSAADAGALRLLVANRAQ